MICRVKIKGQGEHGEVWRWLRRPMGEMSEMRPLGPRVEFHELDPRTCHAPFVVPTRTSYTERTSRSFKAIQLRNLCNLWLNKCGARSAARGREASAPRRTGADKLIH